VAVPVAVASSGSTKNPSLNALLQTLQKQITTMNERKEAEKLAGLVNNSPNSAETGTIFTEKLRFPAKSTTTSLDLNGILGESGTKFFQYHGSLTVPPCTEIVTWFVRRDPLYVASAEDFSLLRHIVYKNSNGNGNYRSVMPQSNRPILLAEGIVGESRKSSEPWEKFKSVEIFFF